MKKVIKKSLLCLGTILFLIVLGLIARIFYTFENAKDMASNANFDFGLLEGMPKSYELLDNTGFAVENGFGCYLLKNEDTTYTISGFPDVLSKYYVTSFYTKSDKYQIYNIKVGMDINEAKVILKMKGYNFDDDYTFRRGIITITFTCTNEHIKEIFIHVPATNIKKVIF